MCLTSVFLLTGRQYTFTTLIIINNQRSAKPLAVAIESELISQTYG